MRTWHPGWVRSVRGDKQVARIGGSREAKGGLGFLRHRGGLGYLVGGWFFCRGNWMDLVGGWGMRGC
jgi:hypothetical protein